jgi:uncharacterized repeat protein (TIGR03806 family)
MLALLLALPLVACGGGEGAEPEPPTVVVTPAPPGDPWETLAEWSLFGDVRAQAPASRVVPYDVISELYADRALKHRFLHIPEGESIGYTDGAKWAFPVGTILVKTFGYAADERDLTQGQRLLETRLLVREPDRWAAHTYVYDDSQTDAVRTIAGTTIPVDWIDAAGAERHNDYGVPNTNQCQECHGTDAALNTLGGRTRQLDRDYDYASGTQNQIEYLAALGWFDAAPTPGAQREKLVTPLGDAPLSDRARSYLDANCGHCHSLGGRATQSGMLLDFPNTDPAGSQATWGVCKVPTSAGGATCGLTFDIVPGQPDRSILMCRVESTDATIRMPPVGTKLPHAEGNALLAEWITSLPPATCSNGG